MFGLFKPKLAPEGPVEIIGEVDIAKPASHVYSLINWADPRNAKRATGSTVREVPGKPDHYEMIMPFMDEFLFTFSVTEQVPNRKYVFGGTIEPQCGNLAHNLETYEIEELGPEECRLTLTTATTFVEGLLMRDYTFEVSAMGASIQSSLQKLKLHAEKGAEVAKAVEENILL